VLAITWIAPSGASTPGIDHNAVAKREAVDAFAERLDDSGTVRADDARLRHDGSPCGSRRRGG